MYYTIELTETKQVKNPNTKTTYKNESIEVTTITDKEYNNLTNNDTVKWFRRLGGSETLQRCFTCAGYKVYKMTSTSPDKQNKTIREFKFIDTSKPKKESEFITLENEQREFDDTLTERMYLENR